MNEIVPNLLEVRASGVILPFQRGIMLNNNALPLLYTNLQKQYGIKFILTNKLNQDCLENFFSAIRSKGGLHDHPSPLEFKYRLRSYLLGLKEDVLCSNANANTADSELLNTSEVEISHSKFEQIVNDTSIAVEDSECQEKIEDEELLSALAELSDIEYDGLQNFGGYLIHKLRLKDYGYGYRPAKGNRLFAYRSTF